VKKKYRILIAEDQTIVREGLCSLLSTNPELEVVGEAADGREAIHLIEKLNPHLVLMDLSMPRTDGLNATREAKRRFPQTRILALTVHNDEEHILAAFSTGADGYALKDSTRGELMVAIKNVLSGKYYICPGISKQMIEGYLQGRKGFKDLSPWMSLTPRERQILKLVAEGYKAQKIGDYLFISPKTVQKHRSNLMKKLDIRTTAGLVAFAAKAGLILK